MEGKPIRVLLIEDNPGDARLIREMFAEAASAPFEAVHEEGLDGALEALRREPCDAVLLDLSLPGSQGLEAFRNLREQMPELPVVVITGRDDEKLAVEAVQRGAQDYLVKGQLTSALLVRSVRYAIERQRLLAELKRRLAFHDPLTGLPNRQLLYDRLSLALAQARRDLRPVAVLFIDLDGFKHINDAHGHGIGDIVLQAAAQRVRDAIRKSDTAARLGGDEFIVILGEVSQPAAAGVVAEKVLEALDVPFDVGGQQLFVSASVGISIYPGDGTDPEALVQNADRAMYRAKARGKNTYQFYNASLDTSGPDRLTLENSLRKALANGEFVVHYQPLVETATGRITSVEALVRCWHPEWGLATPPRFLSVAEESGLIVPIDEWVLRTACAKSCTWQEAGIPPVPVAVNVSARLFRAKRLLEVVARVLADNRLEGRLLVLEIAEGHAMQDVDAAATTIRGLKQLGVRVALDDFGTGYSSVGHLRKMPLDSLKIDRSFVAGIATGDADSAAVAAGVIALAHTLGRKVVAEGVETEAQLEFLRSRQCDEMQGYLFSPPVSADDMAQLLRAGTPLVAGRAAG
jgi:diguanylate cyclase (GGDEF)-like protein